MMTRRDDLGDFLNALGLLGVGAEVGVQCGDFSRQVLDRWRGRLLYLVDVWQPIEGYRDVVNVAEAEQVERMVRTIRQVAPHWGRIRLVQEFSEAAARLIPDGSLDWVYIDADHSLAGVSKDLAAWTPKVRPGGLVAGHDYLDATFHFEGKETVIEVRSAVRAFFDVRTIEATDEPLPTWYVRKPT